MATVKSHFVGTENAVIALHNNIDIIEVTTTQEVNLDFQQENGTSVFQTVLTPASRSFGFKIEKLSEFESRVAKLVISAVSTNAIVNTRTKG